MKGMKMYNRSSIYSLTLKTFGAESQTLKLIEEAGELAAAAARNMNGLGKLIDFQKQKKLERLAERLGVTYAAE